MDKGIQRVKESIVKDIKNYRETCKFIAPLCRKYFEKVYDSSWQHFSGWRFNDNCNLINITYWYEDFYSNTETYTEYEDVIIPLEDIIKMMDEPDEK